MNEIKTHRDLDVWKKSISLVTSIYRTTKEFPKEEVYGITNQIRRSAVSIPSNIAEGSARQGNKEYTQFLYISLGSLSELETQLIIANNLKYLSEKDFELVMGNLIEIRKMLIGLIKFVKNK
jgi:four helix bundle protein